MSGRFIQQIWSKLSPGVSSIARTTLETANFRKNKKGPKKRILTNEGYAHDANCFVNEHEPLLLEESVGSNRKRTSSSGELHEKVLGGDYKVSTVPTNHLPTAVQPIFSAVSWRFPENVLTMAKNDIAPGKVVHPCLPPGDFISKEHVGHDEHSSLVIRLCISRSVFANVSPLLSQQLIEEMVPYVAFSFAGEMRNRVEVVFNYVNVNAQLKGRVFYDKSFQAQLSVPNLEQKLPKLYDRSKLVVVFLSSNYHKKPWCKLEWRFIYRRCGEDENSLMFIKLEDFNPKALGLTKGDGYIDAINMSDEEVAELIIKRYELLISSRNEHV